MFRHILVPTDGSKLSAKAVAQAIGLAKLSGAAITGVYVMAPYSPAMYGEAALYVPEMSRKRYEDLARSEADKALAEFRRRLPDYKIPDAMRERVERR